MNGHKFGGTTVHVSFLFLFLETQSLFQEKPKQNKEPGQQPSRRKPSSPRILDFFSFFF
jgi:hypothetical protein